MSSPDPLFTVVVATFNRGAHILPTLRSILAQEFQDFEVLIVGDGCTDDTEAVLAPYLSDRVRWINLATRWATQSGPNNRGIAEARGRYIAYLGHDDLWEPDHLTRHAARYQEDGPDCVVSGVIMHQGRSGGVDRVLGVFDDAEGHAIAATHFMPPSGLSHTREIALKAGPWKPKHDAAGPVDCEFELRLVAAGARFLSTGQVGVHKFVSSVRYLSYLLPCSEEQKAMWERIQHQRAGGTHDAWRAEKLANAKAAGRFMDGLQSNDAAKGARTKANSDATRGHALPELLDLHAGPVEIAQTPEPRGTDWHGLNKGLDGMRWTGPSDQPKVLVPVTGCGEGAFTVELRLHDAMPRAALSFEWNGALLATQIMPFKQVRKVGPTYHLHFNAPLLVGKPSVLTVKYPRNMMHTQPNTPKLWRGVAIGRIMARMAQKETV